MVSNFDELAKSLFLERNDKEKVERAKNIVKKFKEGIREKGKGIIKKQGTKNRPVLKVNGKNIDESVKEFSFVFREKDLTNMGTYWKDPSGGPGSHSIILRVMDEVVKENLIENLDNIFMWAKNPAIHELTHAFDDIKSDYNVEPPRIGGTEEYFNNDQEVNAYFVEGLSDMIDAIDYRHDGEIPDMWGDFEKFKDRFYRLYLPDSFKNEMRSETEKDVIKRLYQFWSEYIKT